MENNKNILSIDGGGIRGLAVIPQLKALEKILHGRIIDNFHYIAVNSTGGIIGVLLCAGYSPQEIEDFYLEHGEKIFDKKPLRFGLFRPKYDVDYFERVIREKVGDLRLSNIKNNLIVPATNYSERFSNKLVHIFKSSKARVDSSYDYSLFDVIRATTSAQTYFKPHIINDQIFIDGGMCINSPSMMAYYEAVDDLLNEAYSNRYPNVLSISTGKRIPSKAEQSKDNQQALNGGIVEWGAETVNLLLSAQQYMTDYFMTKNSKYGLCKYQRLPTYIKESDGTIDNASKKNMQNLLIDGANSALTNRILINKFVETIK